MMACTFENQPTESHRKLFEAAIEQLLSKIVYGQEDKVVNWKTPESIKECFDFTLDDEPSTHDKVLECIGKTIDLSVKTSKPRFINQMFGGLDPYGMIGQWISDALNTSMYTYEMAPVFVMMELSIHERISSMIGWNPESSESLMSPGGSMANMYAISCARHRLDPGIKKRGMWGNKPLAIFVSEDGHYSTIKGASFMGFGSDSVYTVKTDSVGRMDVEDLKTQIRRSIADGATPLIVVATAGTTVLGAFDEISSIADVCQDYKLWLHVDGAWGGAFLFSERYRCKLAAIERADSVAMDPHKLLGVPLQCSFVVINEKGLLARCHSIQSASYLFQADKYYDQSYDTGQNSLQCSRKVDVFKFWLTWKAKGSAGFRKHVDKLMEKSVYFLDKLRKTPGFELIIENPQMTNVCFHYIPPSLRNLDRSGREFKEKINQVAPTIKKRMVENGKMMIGYQQHHDLDYFFRLVLTNSGTTYGDLDFFLDEITDLGHDL